jgi:NADH-quinone oxidoreductase subunit E
MSITAENHYDVAEAMTEIIDRYQAKPTALIMVLQDIQRHYRYLPKAALELVAQKLDLPIAQIYGVATFFRAFSLKPKGKHHICVCTGTACHVRQANVIVDKFERDLGIGPGGTTPDQQFSLETVNCLGACALGPLVTVDDSFHGNMTVSKVDRILGALRKGDRPEETGEEGV